jgi:tRNA A-37 threonylcarbamoyl transferase component Bud32
MYTALFLHWAFTTTTSSAETIFANRILLSVLKEKSRKDLAKIHQAGVCHGDVCGHNILVDILGNVVYIDFGFSRQYSKKYEARDWESWRQMWTEIEEIARATDPEEL